MVRQTEDVVVDPQFLMQTMWRLRHDWPSSDMGLINVIMDTVKLIHEASMIMTVHSPTCLPAAKRVDQISVMVRRREKKTNRACLKAITIARSILKRAGREEPVQPEWYSNGERYIYAGITSAVWELRTVAAPTDEECSDLILKAIVAIATDSSPIVVVSLGQIDLDHPPDAEPESTHG